LRQRVDVGDRAAQAADDAGLASCEADSIADLHEGQRILRGRCGVPALVAPSARGTPPATVQTTAAPVQAARQLNA
jgi:hypothetical protein